MEADWSVEIGSGLPCIDASWEGFVDLRTAPHNFHIVEATQHPELHETLLALNAKSSAVFTSKCDVWALPAEEIDPDEFCASRENANIGFASYIDILARDPAHFASFSFHEDRCRELVSHFRLLALPQCRVDVVLRAAVMNEQSGYGLTLYAAGCGIDEASAYTAWQVVLASAVTATIAAATNPPHMGE